MATARPYGEQPPAAAVAAAPQQQYSPSTVPSAALGLSNVMRFWLPNPGAHGSGASLSPGFFSTQRQFHLPTSSPSMKTQTIKPQNHRSQVDLCYSSRVPQASPVESVRTAALTPDSHSHHDERLSNPHAVWRSVTPSAHLYNGYRPRPVAPRRSVSVGSRGIVTVEGRVEEPRAPENSVQQQQNLRRVPARFYQEVWGQPVLRPQRAANEYQQRWRCPSVQLLQRDSAQLPNPSALGVSALQPRLHTKYAGGAVIQAPGSQHTASWQRPLSSPERLARRLSPKPHGIHTWRPLSVPPQSSGGPRCADAVTSRADVGAHQYDVRVRQPPMMRGNGGQEHLSAASGSLVVQGQRKVCRSVSTPPLIQRQFPDLASRLWSFFRAGQEPQERESPKAQAVDKRLQCTSNRSRDPLVPSTVDWAYKRQGAQHHLAQAGMFTGADSQPLHQVQPKSQPGQRPSSPHVQLIQNSRQKPTVTFAPINQARAPMQNQPQWTKEQETKAGEWSPDVQKVEKACQGRSATQQEAVAMQMQAALQHRTQLKGPSAQVKQVLSSQQQRDQFLWQQHQLLQKQREVLQQQKEKLMQQQACWQQQRQRTLPQKEAGASGHPQAPPIRLERDTSVESCSTSCGVDIARGSPSKVSTELQGSSSFARSSGVAGSATAVRENGKVSFTMVGGSMEQRMQLKCEVIGHHGVALAEPTLSSGLSSIRKHQQHQPSEVADFGCTRDRTEGALAKQQQSQTHLMATPRKVVKDPKEGTQTATLGCSATATQGPAEQEGSCSPVAGTDTLVLTDTGDVLNRELQAERREQEPFPQHPQVSRRCKLRRRDQDCYKVGPHDLLPVGPLIAAICSLGESGKEEGERATADECTEDISYIEAYLPIKSLSELESVEKGQEAEDLLDLRRDVVGCGTYGVVRKLRHKKGGFVVAVKSIQKETVVRAGMVDQVEFELYVQRDLLRHQNVLRCFSCVEDAEYLHMILGYCDQGDLYRRIRKQPNRRFSELEAFCFFAQLINGLQCVHSSGVIHRDLKLENLLLTKGYVLKIADFGWCGSVVGQNRSFSFCGTLDYLAPEMVKGQGHDWRVDLWSLGVLLYELLDGRPPFQSTRHFELVQRIVTVDIRMPCHVSSDAADLIRKLLKYDPSERLPLIDVAQHPWVHRMWKELQLHLLQRDPSVDIEALLPAIASPWPSSELLYSGAPHHDPRCHIAAEAAGACGKHSTAKGFEGVGRSSATRNAIRSPVVPIKMQLTDKGTHLPPLSGRRGPNSVYHECLPSERSLISLSTERMGRKRTSIVRNGYASLNHHPRRRTLPKPTTSATQSRAIRSTSKALGSATARQLPTSRYPESAETAPANSSAKKSPLKRPSCAAQRQRGRNTPLLDQSFDLQSAAETADTCDASALTTEANTCHALHTTVDGATDQQETISCKLLPPGDDSTTRDDRPRQVPITELHTGAHSRRDASLAPSILNIPLPASATFDQESLPKSAAEQKLVALSLSADVIQTSASTTDATALPSLKKVRSASTRPRGCGSGGAVLRMQSTPHKAPEAPATCDLYRGVKDCHGQQGMGPGSNHLGLVQKICKGTTLTPHGRTQGVAHLDPFHTQKPWPSMATATSGLSVMRPSCLTSSPSQHSQWHPAVAVMRPALPGRTHQWRLEQMVHPSSLSRLQQFESLPSSDSTGNLHYPHLPKYSAGGLHQTLQMGDRSRPQLHMAFQPTSTQKQRLVDLVADSPPGRRFYSPPSNGLLSWAQQQPKQTPSPLAKRQPCVYGMEKNVIPGLPVVVGIQNPTSPKFLSNPTSLFN
ncbi:uncharacterized protein LOC113147069 [Cyclospora cayetanensis]|uniref:Aurora kinase n=1 Tax=Cyclospora cayetanensis TaxID=88456 RepID=A0A6P6RW16_9EIME|nr:uncharacterized protein LOC113147069 [Cyclospora cayetanensis]